MNIRDPIHEYIELDETEEKLISDWHMQRLRYVKQNGFSYLVYPGANHSRFEHSLGTMHVTNEINWVVYKKDDPELRALGLMHDIGHGPFSHESEPLIKKYLNKTHEQVGEDIISKSSIRDIINDSTISYKKLMRYFGGEKYWVIAGALGSDRIDYLIRDSYYTGVAYGIIDYPRIKSKLTLFRNKLAIYEQGISGAEGMLIARYFMFTNVYNHHTTTIVDNMFRNALEFAIESGDLDPKELLESADDELMNKLEDVSVSKDLVTRVKRRDLFKRAYYEVITKDVDIDELKSAIGKAGVKKSDYIIAINRLDKGKEDIFVVDRNKELIGRLADISPLVKTLTDILNTERRLIVACDKKNIEKVRRAVQKAL